MRYYWIEDRIKKQEIQLIWKPGKYSRADHFTKHHPPVPSSGCGCLRTFISIRAMGIADWSSLKIPPVSASAAEQTTP